LQLALPEHAFAGTALRLGFGPTNASGGLEVLEEIEGLRAAWGSTRR
jgi:hypothetical protein